MWLKIKVWTKVVLFGLVLLYALIFIYMNGDKTASFWYWPRREPQWPVLFLTLGAFFTGVIVTILLRTTFKTIRQVRELQSRSRAERLQREVEAMKTKAAMLRTREGGAGGGAEATAPAEPTPADPAP
jgi:uncharacterized integral membrane protein